MKKRMLLLGMAIWMAAALAGCGNDTTASTDQATAADQEQSENATTETQTDGSQTDANIEQAATGAPLIQIENQQKDWHSDDGSKWLMHAETQQLRWRFREMMQPLRRSMTGRKLMHPHSGKMQKRHRNMRKMIWRV